MDYAAALRAAPSGPAVKLDTTPAAKQVASKPAPKPTKVVAVEHAPIVEEDVVSSVAVAAAPAKPPTNAGLSPVVRFVINVPHSGSNANVKESASTENNADDSDSSDNADEEATGDVSANGAKSNPSKDAKTHNFSAQDLENVRFPLHLFPSIIICHFQPYSPILEVGKRPSLSNREAPSLSEPLSSTPSVHPTASTRRQHPSPNVPSKSYGSTHPMLRQPSQEKAKKLPRPTKPTHSIFDYASPQASLPLLIPTSSILTLLLCFDPPMNAYATQWTLENTQSMILRRNNSYRSNTHKHTASNFAIYDQFHQLSNPQFLYTKRSVATFFFWNLPIHPKTPVCSPIDLSFGND